MNSDIVNKRIVSFINVFIELLCTVELQYISVLIRTLHIQSRGLNIITYCTLSLSFDNNQVGTNPPNGIQMYMYNILSGI